MACRLMLAFGAVLSKLMQARLTVERTGYALADIQALSKPDKEVIWLETAQEEIEGIREF